MRQINYILIVDSAFENNTYKQRHQRAVNRKYHFIVNRDNLISNPLDIRLSGTFLDNYDSCSIGIYVEGSIQDSLPDEMELKRWKLKPTVVIINLLVRLRFLFPGAKILGASEINGRVIHPNVYMNHLRRMLSDLP